MERIKTIDTFRGICMFIMVYGHMFDWWLTSQDYWLFESVLKPLLGPIGAAGFVFISGISTMLSYRKNISKDDGSNINFKKDLRNVYFTRAFLLLLIALIYNFTVAVRLNNLSFIWAWLILQTLSISLILAYPFLKTAKSVRLITCILLLCINQLILRLLTPFQGQLNGYGVLYHIIFNPVEHYIILPYFSIFLFGTVIGDMLVELNAQSDGTRKNWWFKNYIIPPMIMSGLVLIVIGLVYEFPSFFIYGTFSSIIYSFGIVISLLSIMLTIEELNLIKTKKSYKYLSYYSFYSFTIYIGHNLLFFLFTAQLTVVTIWIPVIISIILFGFLLRALYNYIGNKLSLKTGINYLSLLFVREIQIRRNESKSALISVK